MPCLLIYPSDQFCHPLRGGKKISSISRVSHHTWPSLHFWGSSSPRVLTDLLLLPRVPPERPLVPPPVWFRTRAQPSSIQFSLHPEHRVKSGYLPVQSLPAGPNFLQDLGRGGGADEEMVRVLEAVLGFPSLPSHPMTLSPFAESKLPQKSL